MLWLITTHSENLKLFRFGFKPNNAICYFFLRCLVVNYIHIIFIILLLLLKVAVPFIIVISPT